MNRFVALALLVVVSVAAIVLMMHSHGLQRGNQSPGDSLSILDAIAVLHQQADKRATLDFEFMKVQARIASKREIAQRVIDGSLTLSEAAALFRGLIAECEYPDLVHAANVGETEEERIHADVIGWVAGELDFDPPRQAAEVERLQAELKSRIR